MSFDPITFDAVSQGNAGDREPRIGEFYITPKIDRTKEIQLNGSVYDRAAWPLIENRFNSPHPKLGQFVRKTNLLSANNASLLRYNPHTDTLICLYNFSGATCQRSLDRGNSWQAFVPSGGHALPSPNAPVIALEYSQQQNVLLAVRQTQDAGNQYQGFAIERSVDDGTNWTTVHTGAMNSYNSTSSAYVQGDQYDRSPRGHLTEIDGVWLFLTTSNVSDSILVVHRSEDQGLTWTVHNIAVYSRDIAVPRIFKQYGKYYIYVRRTSPIQAVQVYSISLDFASAVHLIINAPHTINSYQNHQLLQLGNDVYGVYGTNDGSLGDLMLASYDLLSKTMKSTNLSTNTVAAQNALLIQLNKYDAAVISGGTYQGSYYTKVNHIRDLKIATHDPDRFSTPVQSSNDLTTLAQLGLPTFTPTSYVCATGNNNGLVFLKIVGEIYMSEATYPSQFQAPSLTGSGYPTGVSINGSLASTLYQVMRGAL